MSQSCPGNFSPEVCGPVSSYSFSYSCSSCDRENHIPCHGQLTPCIRNSSQSPKSQLPCSIAYGIFYSCTYFQSLLRDRLFTIRTDHQDSLFIKETSDRMILQEFIAGVDNSIADLMSRLCRNNSHGSKLLVRNFQDNFDSFKPLLGRFV